MNIKQPLRTVSAVALLPLLAGTVKAFYSSVTGIAGYSSTLHLFERGALIYLFMHVTLLRPVYLYVLGHEMVHVLATWLCGGKVRSFRVTPSGGNVVTTKTNFFIELSPYFVPFYTLLLSPLFGLFRITGITLPHSSSLLVFLVGFTLAFHFAMTSEALRIQQSDISKSGFLFSLVTILLGNMILIIGVFSPLFRNLQFKDFLEQAWYNITGNYEYLYSRARLIIENIRLLT